MALYALNSFDETYYLLNNPDVVTAIANGIFPSALDHYELYGEAEGRMPNCCFDPQYYAAENPDVLAALNAGIILGLLWHFENFGLAEGRRPSEAVDFNEANYLALYPDVADAVAAGIFESGWQHYVLYGVDEGRDPGGDTPPVGETILLTTLQDDIVLDGTQVDTVQGIVDPGSPTQTFTVFDNIDGNDATIVELGIAGAGTAAFATISDVDQVNLVAGTPPGTIEFNAATWTNIGSINLTSGTNGLRAEFENVPADATEWTIPGVTDWTISGVDGALSATFTDDTQFSMSSDQNGSISWVDGVVDGTAGPGEDVYFYFSSDGQAGDIVFGDVTLTGSGGDSATFSVDHYLYNGATGDLTIGNVNISGFTDEEYFDVYSYNDQNSGPANTTVGSIMVAASGSGDFSVTVEQQGYNNVGDVTVGPFTGSVDANGYGYYYVENYGYDFAVGDNVTVGTMTLGDIALDVGQSGTISAEFSHTAAADDGVATVGDLTMGNFDATLAQAAYGDLELDHYAYSPGPGGAVVGASTIGDTTLDLATDASFYASIDISAYSTGGDATVGDVVIGSITVAQGVNSDVELDYYVEADAAAARVAQVGSVTVGDLTVDANDGATFSYTFSIDAYGTTADIGNVQFGNVQLAGGVSASMDLYYDIYSDTNIGNITFGDLDVSVRESGDFSGSFDVSAADGAIGDVQFGNIALAAAMSASADFYISMSGETAIGDVTVGDVSLSAIGDNADVTFSLTVENDGSGTIGAVTVGDVLMQVDGQGADAFMFVSASSAWSAGVMTIGNLDMSVDNPATSGFAYVTFDATNDLGDLVIGNIDMSTSSLQATGNTNEVRGYVTGDANGDLTVGDVTVSGGDGAVDNFATLTGWLSLTAGGDITIGNVDYSGYGAEATIDVSGYRGAAEIAGSAYDDVITDNSGTNAVTGNDGADRFVFVDSNTGQTETTLDQIMDFNNAGGDKIDLTPVVNVGNYSEGTYADFAAYTTAAAAADKVVFAGEVGGVDGVILAVDFNNDTNVDFMIQLVGVDLGGVDVASFV